MSETESLEKSKGSASDLYKGIGREDSGFFVPGEDFGNERRGGK